MRRIYAAHLDFSGDPAQSLAAARAHTRRWASRPWGGWPAAQSGTNGSFTAEDDSNVRWRTLDGDAARLWELRVDAPFVDDSTMRQITLVQVGTDAGSPFAYVQVSLRSTDGSLTGGVVYENGAPDIVPILVREIPCADGHRRLDATAWRITRAQESSLAQLLTAQTRQLPVLLLVSDAAFTSDDADATAVGLAGLAHVCVTPRAQLTGLLTTADSNAPDGAAAYLWWAHAPGQPRRRPQWFRGEALAPSQWGLPAWPVVRTIFGVAAFRIDQPALAAHLEADATRRRFRALEARAASSEADAELLRGWEADLVTLEQTQRHAADIASENDRLQGDLNAVLSAFDLAVEQAAQKRHEISAESQRPEPKTLAEAIKFAAEDCAELTFLPEAIRSADAWHYSRPQVVLHALGLLDQLARSWRTGELTGSLMVAARVAGLPWRPAISQTAQTQYRDDYLRHLDGRDILMGPHLAWGNSPENALRIYLYLDRDAKRIVVGHAGRHLRDTSNPHL